MGYKTMDGNEAVSRVSYKFTELAGIYPITPASPMAEKIDILSSTGEINFWGNKVKVIEMQSEKGAVATIHGCLQSGILATTYTASQGLLLMLPSIYKMAGECLPAVIHVAARSLSTHSLSIFGDHQDIYAVRQTGACMLSSSSVEEAYHMAMISHLSSIKSSLPFINFFDGFRTSHEIDKIKEIDLSKLEPLIDKKALKRFRENALVGTNTTRGTAENDDIYFQHTEARNIYYNKAIENTIYYMNSDWTDFVVKRTNIDQLEATENTIDKLMNLLITSTDDKNCQIPVPMGMTYQRYAYDGQGVVTIMFNLDYETAENYQILLCKMAFTNTLCQVEGVDKVSFELSDLIGERELDTSVYSEQSFSTIDGNFLKSDYSVDIYVPDTTGKRLDKKTIVIDAMSYKTSEEQVMENLRNSKEWKSPLGDDIDILDIYVQDRVCYVNYSSSFLTNVEQYDDRVLLYSVVNSLVQLSDVDRVVFKIDGKQDLIYGENLDFTRAYTADYSICN